MRNKRKKWSCAKQKNKESLKDGEKTDKHGKSVHSAKITESMEGAKNTALLMKNV